jgi:methyltransferase
MVYTVFLISAALEMLCEAFFSLRNSRRLLAQGAVEVEPQILPVMILLYVLMYPACFAEYFFLRQPLQQAWVMLFAFVFVLAKALKLWAVSSLGKYWTMRVLILPQSKTVSSGPYRWIKHPNYVAVIMEIAATCLLGKCFLTFFVIAGSFAVVLRWRICSEEQALQQHTDYSVNMNAKRRFIP